MKKVLIALDYSDATPVVVKKGVELAQALNADITLIHVLSDATYYSSLNYSPIFGFDSFSSLDIVQTNTVDSLREAAQEFLNRIKADIHAENADTIIGEGDFADEILKAATAMKADIIIMGTHSRKGIDKILMGSVAQKVLHKSEIPVLIIPIRKH
mgnify:CR=1 FL=1